MGISEMFRGIFFELWKGEGVDVKFRTLEGGGLLKSKKCEQGEGSSTF